jgi:hypothetical protein
VSTDFSPDKNSGCWMLDTRYWMLDICTASQVLRTAKKSKSSFAKASQDKNWVCLGSFLAFDKNVDFA